MFIADASPIKQGPRAKRASDREETRFLCFSVPASIVESRAEPGSSELETAATTSTGHQLQTAGIGQQLLESDYHVHELPACDEPTNDNCSPTINAALVAHIEMLEAENSKLKSQTENKKYFWIECVEHDDNLVCFIQVLCLIKFLLPFLISLDLLFTSFTIGIQEKVIISGSTIKMGSKNH